MARRSLVSIEDDGGDRWYFSRKEIEENSPSRRDGIDLTKETYFRKSYCTFLQELGMRLKVPQITIATATIFCHRFFLRQSHGKHNRRTIATVCFFLASKVEETPRPLRNVIVLSYEIIHKKDPETVRRIFKQEGVFEQQKKLILQGEKLVLAFLDFDLSVCHPYKPLVEAIRKFKVADPNALAQVAWNFVNDGLRMTLCLQFKPHEIAAGAIFLAAKFLKLKLPSDGQKAWWQVLAVTPSQLEEVSNQMLELYEQNRMPRPSQAKASEAECRPPSKVLADGENAHSGTGPVFSRSIVDQANADNHLAPVRVSESQNKNCTNSEMHHTSECKGDGEINDNQQSEQQQFPHQGNVPEIQNTSRIDFDPQCQQEQEKIAGRMEALEAKHVSLSQPPLEAVKKKVENKVKAALEKRRKLGPDASRKEVFMDEDEMIEMQLENGIELY